jgi:hypothetical protein
MSGLPTQQRASETRLGTEPWFNVVIEGVSSRRLSRDLAWLCACVALLAGCTGPSIGRNSSTRVSPSIPTQCSQHLGRELLISADAGGGPLHLVVGHGLWLRFTGGGAGWRWSLPVSTSPAVARFRFTVRCPGGVVVAGIRALAPGSAELHATLESGLPDPPVFGWRVRLRVTRHRLPTPPPPAESRMIRGGGILVWPEHLYFDGAETRFTVPRVSCRVGNPSRVRVGLFGVRHFIPPTGTTTGAPWWAGLSITCSASGHANYTVGYDNLPQLGRVQPGDDLDVSTSGADCPSVVINVSAPHSTVGMGYGGPGCSAGKHNVIRALIQPTILFGAHVDGPGPRRIAIALRSLAINGQPLSMAPHTLRSQHRDHTSVVTVRPTRDWYRSQLAIA